MASLEQQSNAHSSLSLALETLTDSVSGALAALPHDQPHHDASDKSSVLAPADGISLLDTKNEVLLSYLQTLAFFLLLQVRRLNAQPLQRASGLSQDVTTQEQEVVNRLVELRSYLERGVKPLENRLKYQVDKILKAADDAERTQRIAAGKKETKRKDIAGGSDTDSSTGSKMSGASSDEDETEEDEDIDELAYRPNLAALSKGTKDTENPATSTKSTPGDGVYRPPKIKPTALPMEASDRRSDREPRRPAKSRVIDEFVSAEMSVAPMAEPSIGSTIRAGGREVRTQRQREIEAERRSYEETNFVRLPKESKKDRAQRGAKRQGGFGGEDWRSLGEGADRIERLTRRNKGAGGALEKSRKRRLTEDGPRGDGVSIGEGFEKRRKKVAGWKK
ncbi:predicted protein [Uncinocarpus reesii 1704]|uniref:Uncharacterized protein n=1 Tax=Uncinocarpus reesii (strain UAMH 1704) TaxID=336963 RepID=C4JNH9_UNCRE|nr:uncharacterized protein UREG_02977 [Uncinocarpus reesii 1704]EEP78132.1 predicted protein [Uncinocarpus reesii 1704]